MTKCSVSDYLALITARDEQIAAENMGAPHCEAFWISLNWFLSEAQPHIEPRYLDYTHKESDK